MLNYQSALDGKSASWSIPGETYGHFELGRGFLNNIIPKPTSAIKAVDKIINSNFDSSLAVFSYRVPTSIVGSADISLILKNKIDRNTLIKEIEKINLKEKIILINEKPLTSLDMLGSKYNCVLDMRWLDIINKNNLTFIKIIIWYDNEYGYAQNIVKLIKKLI